MARIYISSTYSDLKEYREIVYRTLRQLRHDVIAMEDYVATDVRPVKKCLRDVAACDVYIGIFAYRYGYVPKEDNPEGRSITELEYRKAGESGVARLVFLLKDGAPWPTTLMDALCDEQAARRIAALRDELKTAHIDSFFESGEELARKVSVAVQQELDRRPAERVQIDWEGPRRRLIEHMRRFAGARSEQDALQRYLPMVLQATNATDNKQLPVGTWNDLVTYPSKVLLTGEAGSGKTTLLLYEAQRLAAEAREISATPLPVYVPLSTFARGDADRLLEMAAEENRIDLCTLRTLWSHPIRPVCLFLDGGDENMYRHELIDAIIELAAVFDRPPSDADAAEVRSLVVACHPGPLQDRIAKLDASWREFLLVPLLDAAMDSMLTRFDAASLIPFLDERLRQTIRRPDLLSALAQSTHDRPVELLPHNAAEIYGLYLSHIFNTTGGQYDYERIKRPVVAHVAYEMVRKEQPAMACDDSLYELMAVDLEALDRRYHRRRCVMPYDWSAEELHDEIVRSPVVDLATGRGQMLMFSKPIYRDYFVAVHLEAIGVNSQVARDLVARLSSSDQLQPLSFLLGMNPEAASLFDALPETALSAAAQIWLEDKAPDAKPPISIRNGFRNRCAAVRSEVFKGNEPGALDDRRRWALDDDPRRRFKIVSGLARQRPLPALQLLDAARDDHPLVRAVAHHALLHAGDPRAVLSLRAENGSFQWHSSGAGDARIGPLQLLRVPLQMVLDVSVQIDQLDIDPFNVDASFSFLPMSPALFAANLFVDRAVDWLELLARFHEIAAESEALGRRAGSSPGLSVLASGLSRRACSYTAVGLLLASDLGVPWEGIELPFMDDTERATAEGTYKDLRRLFSRTNQGHTLRLSHLSRDPVFNVSQRLERIAAGGTVLGVNVENFERRVVKTADEMQRFTFINNSQQIGMIDGGIAHGIEIGRIRGDSRELPISVQINDRLDVDTVARGEVGGILIQMIESAVCPLRVNLSMRIGRFTDSRLFGVSVNSYQPQSPAE